MCAKVACVRVVVWAECCFLIL